jgi:hypothetical protein
MSSNKINKIKFPPIRNINSRLLYIYIRANTKGHRNAYNTL